MRDPAQGRPPVRCRGRDIDIRETPGPAGASRPPGNQKCHFERQGFRSSESGSRDSQLYNNEDAFNLSKTYLGAYRARLNANLAFYDALDGKTDWPLDEHGNHPLTELLLADFPVVDVSKPFRETSYFEIEAAVLKARAHATCGGRWLNEDIIDFILTLYINAGNGPRISDGVDAPIAWSSKSFPYLAPPNPPKGGVS